MIARQTCVAALLALLYSPATLAAETRPNILFIMVDEMRWNVMGCAGDPIARTPHLDRLAREGTRFATAYTCAPICAPSRYSFFTSRYAHVHGAVDNGTPPRDGQLILPAILKHYGYQTAISGKLHFTPNWRDYSFDYFWSCADEGPGILQRWPDYLAAKYDRVATRLAPGSQPYADDPLGRDLGKLTYPKEDYQTFWITDRAVEFLDQRDRSRPFFLFVSYVDPHSPSHLPEPYWSMFKPADMPRPTIPEEVKRERAEAIVRGSRGPSRHLIDDETMAQALLANYYGTMAMVDDNVGRLLAALESRGLARDTILVFTADHGNMLGDLGRWFKGVMYEGSSRIPLIMRAPSSGPAAETFNRGRVVDAIVENIDVMPTLLEMAGVPFPSQGIQGRSMVKLVAGREENWKSRAFSERSARMIRTPRYKLIQDDRRLREGKSEYQLYDLNNDPRELRDLAGDPAYARVVEQLAAELEVWQNDQPPLPAVPGMKTPEHAFVSPADLRRIKKSGGKDDGE